jgi:hypothetical protein
MNETAKDFVQDCLKPFKPHEIDQLPKGGTTLDYVSHARVTRRLLELDPNWNWTPAAWDHDGLPKFDDKGGLWIWLTINGHTRLGYGEAVGGFTDADKTKAAIGDAIRNAAMRFGIALALWESDSRAKLVAEVKQELLKAGAKTKPEALALGVKILGAQFTEFESLTVEDCLTILEAARVM